MAPIVNVQSELERWFYNYRELSLNERINLRGMMRQTHYRILGVPLSGSTKNEIGELVNFSRKLLKNPDLPKYLKAACVGVIAQSKN